MLKWFSQSDRRLALGLLLGGLLVRSAIALFLPPGFDEAYYYLYTQHLDWSYFDHPMMVALSTGFGVWLTGQVSQFTIRLGTLLLHTGALWLLYLTSLRLFSSRVALLTLTIASLIPIFLVGFGVLTLPDASLIFFWTAALYVAVGEFGGKAGRQAEGRRQKAEVVEASLTPNPYSLTPTPYSPTYRLAIVGLLVGLACLSKYHGLALGFGLFGFCLTSTRYRPALRSPWMLLGFVLFALAISPIVYWNAQYDWVSLRFQSGRAVPDRGYSLLELLGTFLVGTAYLFPTFGFPLWWTTLKTALATLFKNNLKNKTSISPSLSSPSPSSPSPSPTTHHPSLLSPPPSLLLWLSLPLMLGFTLMGGYRPILPTWAMPGFWSAVPLLGWRAATWQQKSPRGVRRWLWGSGIAIATLLLIALLHVNLGTFQKPGRYSLFGGFLSPSTDASVQFIDTRQLRAGFVESAALQKAVEQADFLFTNDLFLAGQVAMAIAPLSHPPITVLDQDLRGFAFWSTADAWVGKNGLLVTPSSKAGARLVQYQGYFETIQKIAEIPIQRGGVIVETIQVYQCDRLLKPYPRPYGK